MHPRLRIHESPMLILHAQCTNKCKLNYQCSLAQAHAITYMPAYNSTCAHMRARNREGATCIYGLLFGRSNSRIPVQMHASTLSHTLSINTRIHSHTPICMQVRVPHWRMFKQAQSEQTAAGRDSSRQRQQHTETDREMDREREREILPPQHTFKQLAS